MKRWYYCFAVGILILTGVWILTASGVDPMNYVGKWYLYEDKTPYLFHNGIIISEKYHLSTESNAVFSGAYSFAKDRIVLFYIDGDGVEKIRELTFVSHSDGDRLVDQTDGTNTIVFYRKKE